MLFGNFRLALEVVFFRAQQSEIAIQISFDFVVEDDANRAAARALDAGGLFLVEAIEVGIVFRLARFEQAVIDGLVLGQQIAFA